MGKRAGLKRGLLAAAALAVLAAAFFCLQRPRPIAQVMDSIDLRLDAAYPAPVLFAEPGEGYYEVSVSQDQFLRALSSSAPVTPEAASSFFNASQCFFLSCPASGADVCSIYLGPDGQILFMRDGKTDRQWRDGEHIAYDTLYQLAFGSP